MHAEPTPSSNGFGTSCNGVGSSELDGDYWSLLPEGDRNLGSPFQMQSSSPTEDSTSTVTPANPGRTPEHTQPSSPDSLGRGEGQGLQAQFAASASHGRSEAPVLPSLSVQDLAAQTRRRLDRDKSPKTGTRGDGRVTKRDARTRKARGSGRPQHDSLSCIVGTYVILEGEKDITSQEHTHIGKTMKAYENVVLQAPATSQLPLAILATSIGDCSALLLLKEAIQGLRSSSSSDCLCIDKLMTVSERIRIIEQIGVCTALLRLVRLLHIVTLWEDLSWRAGGASDRFVVVTPDLVTQHTTRRGNPRNLARADIAQGLSDPQGSHDRSSQNDTKSTRLRRLGQRLGLIAGRWGQGALLILGQGLSENR